MSNALPDLSARSSIAPFKAGAHRAEPRQLKSLLTTIYEEEAERLAIGSDEYMRATLDELYERTNAFWDDHFLVHDQKTTFDHTRGGTLLQQVRQYMSRTQGRDLERTAFGYEQVLFDSEQPGYNSLHEFLNRVNPHLQRHNLFCAYFREQVNVGDETFCDHLGLIEGVPLLAPQWRDASQDVFHMSVRDGTLYIAPLASCEWNLAGEWATSTKQFSEFNRATPDEMRQGLVSKFAEIREYQTRLL